MFDFKNNNNYSLSKILSTYFVYFLEVLKRYSLKNLNNKDLSGFNKTVSILT